MLFWSELNPVVVLDIGLSDAWLLAKSYYFASILTAALRPCLLGIVVFKEVRYNVATNVFGCGLLIAVLQKVCCVLLHLILVK